MRPTLQRALLVLAVAGSLVLLNVLGLRAFGRLDLTKDRVFTLSSASKEAVRGLEDPVTISAYFTADLPAPYSSNARYVRDLLEEYRSASGGKLAFEFIDPTATETAEDKEKKKEVKRDIFGRAFREPTQVERELSSSGIQPVEVRVVEEDQVQTRRAYMGLVIRYRDQRESIPVVQDTSTLEYDLTSLIRKLSRAKTPVVGFVLPEGDAGDAKFDQLKALFQSVYEVRPVKLSETLPAEVDALFVLAPQAAPDAQAQKNLEAFLAQGKSAAFFLDTVKVDLRSFQASKVDHGFGPLLSSWGVSIGSSLVADVRAAMVTVEEERGPFRFQRPAPYPFVPQLLQLEGDSPITKGLTRMNFPFSAPVNIEQKDGITTAVLAKSSEKSWLESEPYDTNPRREWREEPAFGGPYNLLVQVTGKQARLIVAGTSAIAWDAFLDPRSGGASNQMLMLNVADFLLLDPAMLSMRTRGLSDAPLKPELSDGTRAFAKFGNAVGVPLVLALCGVVYWRLRERRRERAGVFA